MISRQAKRARPPLRLAIVSTPRTGNNWLQNLLARVYDLPRYSPVNLSNLDRQGLPRECVLILHERRRPAVLSFLRQEQFRVLSLARHPLDVLISILQFSLHEFTSGWLEGEGGGEQAILGLTPCSPGFLDYACGPRAAALLAVTADWWQAGDCHKVRYEDLVSNPQGEIERLAGALAVPIRLPIAAAVSATTLPEFRRQFPDCRHHFWQGQPGLWKQLLPARAANHIATVHTGCFNQLGFTCDPDPMLTDHEAQAEWRKIMGLPAGGDATLATLQKALHEVSRDLEQTRARLASLNVLGPRTLRLAQRLHGWFRQFFPRRLEGRLN